MVTGTHKHLDALINRRTSRLAHLNNEQGKVNQFTKLITKIFST